MPNQTYLFIMFFIVQVCALHIVAVGLCLVKGRMSPCAQAQSDARDWLLVMMAICLQVQALHYLFQALGLPLHPDWISTVRAASTVIPILQVLYLLNGQVNHTINRLLRIFSRWSLTSKT